MKKIFLEPKKKEVSKEALNQLSELEHDKIGLLTVIQHLEQMKKVEAELERLGKRVYKTKGDLTKYKGQILGCDISAAEKIKEQVECFLYVGTGIFHPLPVALELGKPVFLFKPNQGLERLKEDEVNKYRRKLVINLEEVKRVDRIGILISNKPGQENREFAIEIKKKLENKGKKAYLFYFNTLNPEGLIDFPGVGAWVNTACPRIGIDDLDRFERPIVNASQLIKDGI